MLSKGARYLTAAVLANIANAAPARLSLARRAVEEPFAVLDPQIWVNPDSVSGPGQEFNFFFFF